MKILFISCFFFLFNISAQAISNTNPIDMSHLSQIHYNGGSFWEGYLHYRIKVSEGVLKATWDRRQLEGDGRILRHTGRKELSETEIEKIVQSLTLLKMVKTEERCGIGADGPEESLVLSFDHVTTKLRLVNQRSRPFVCGDHYITDISFDQFKETLKGIYPNPFDSNFLRLSSLWHLP